MEERIDEVQLATGKKDIAQVHNERIKQLERELQMKEEAEKTLEDSLKETKIRYEKIESEVNNFADELQRVKQQLDDETRKRKQAEDDVMELKSAKKKLEDKFQETMKSSGTNNDLIDKLSNELRDKELEFDKREKKLKEEINEFYKLISIKDNEIKDLKIQFEDKKSLNEKFEKKIAEQDKLIREHENKVTWLICAFIILSILFYIFVF